MARVQNKLKRCRVAGNSDKIHAMNAFCLFGSKVNLFMNTKQRQNRDKSGESLDQFDFPIKKSLKNQTLFATKV